MILRTARCLGIQWLHNGNRAEVQKPHTTVVLGGVISAKLVTLVFRRPTRVSQAALMRAANTMGVPSRKRLDEVGLFSGGALDPVCAPKALTDDKVLQHETEPR